MSDAAELRAWLARRFARRRCDARGDAVSEEIGSLPRHRGHPSSRRCGIAMTSGEREYVMEPREKRWLDAARQPDPSCTGTYHVPRAHAAAPTFRSTCRARRRLDEAAALAVRRRRAAPAGRRTTGAGWNQLRREQGPALHAAGPARVSGRLARARCGRVARETASGTAGDLRARGLRPHAGRPAGGHALGGRVHRSPRTGREGGAQGNHGLVHREEGRAEDAPADLPAAGSARGARAVAGVSRAELLRQQLRQRGSRHRPVDRVDACERRA